MRQRTVIVNLVDGRTTIAGQRRWSWPWQIRLTGARVHQGAGEPMPVDGTVVIPRRRVDWFQVVA